MTFYFTARRTPRETAHKFMHGEFKITIKAKSFDEAERNAKKFMNDYPKWSCGASGGWTTDLEFNGVDL